jgi:hypothetical protein
LECQEFGAEIKSFFFFFRSTSQTSTPNLGAQRKKKPLTSPKFGTELWNAERKKPLNIPKIDAKHWSSERFFELWRVERKKNLSTFQSLAPNFEALKAFIGIPSWCQG